MDFLVFIFWFFPPAVIYFLLFILKKLPKVWASVERPTVDSTQVETEKKIVVAETRSKTEKNRRKNARKKERKQKLLVEENQKNEEEETSKEDLIVEEIAPPKVQIIEPKEEQIDDEQLDSEPKVELKIEPKIEPKIELKIEKVEVEENEKNVDGNLSKIDKEKVLEELSCFLAEKHRRKIELFQKEIEHERRRISDLLRENQEKTTIVSTLDQRSNNVENQYKTAIYSYQNEIQRLTDEQKQNLHQLQLYSMMPNSFNELKQQQNVLLEQVRHFVDRNALLEKKIAENRLATRHAQEIYQLGSFLCFCDDQIGFSRRLKSL